MEIHKSQQNKSQVCTTNGIKTIENKFAIVSGASDQTTYDLIILRFFFLKGKSTAGNRH